MGVCELHWPIGAEICRPHRLGYIVIKEYYTIEQLKDEESMLSKNANAAKEIILDKCRHKMP